MATATTIDTQATANPLAKYQTKSTSSNGSTASTNEEALNKLSQDYTTFLKLLTTQLQNQDPTSPMDSAQFTQQLVQFSSVEQQIKGNQKLDSLIGLQKNSNGVSSMLGYLGKTVEMDGNQFLLKTGETSQFSYTLSDSTDKATIKVFDKDGKLVRTDAGSTTLGKHVIAWDGKDDDGNLLVDGTYKVSVEAKNKSGDAVSVKTTGYGTVNGVETTSSGAVLNVGNLKIATDKILAIKEKTVTAL